MRKIKLPIITILITLVLISCVSPSVRDVSTSTSPATSTDILITSTSTQRPTRVPPTPKPSPSPTWTPLPTLSSAEAEQTVVDLLKSNGGCKLPCWWGTVPGETRWNEVEQFLNTFVTFIGQGQEGTFQEDDGFHHYTNYGAEFFIPDQEARGRVLYGVRDGIIIDISVDPPGNEFSYQLYQLLSTYGEPREVYVFTYSNVPSDVVPFRVLVRYPEQGIHAIYEYPAENDGNMISSCPDSSAPSLHLDSSNQPYEKYLIPFEDSAKRLMGMNENDPLVDLQTATQMDLKTFYETFKNQNSDICLKTSASMW
jgi:hypothetical protein